MKCNITECEICKVMLILIVKADLTIYHYQLNTELKYPPILRRLQGPKVSWFTKDRTSNFAKLKRH